MVYTKQPLPHHLIFLQFMFQRKSTICLSSLCAVYTKCAGLSKANKNLRIEYFYRSTWYLINHLSASAIGCYKGIKSFLCGSNCHIFPFEINWSNSTEKCLKLTKIYCKGSESSVKRTILATFRCFVDRLCRPANKQ